MGKRDHSQGVPIDIIDIVKDPVPPSEYKIEEDPKLFQSIKTHRGPLSDNWIQEYKKRLLPIMCAYKLCKVEFRYWGMQSKIERFIHDTGECVQGWGTPARLPMPIFSICWLCTYTLLLGSDSVLSSLEKWD